MPLAAAHPTDSRLGRLAALLRRGLVALAFAGAAHAGAPARVWINGNDIDGPPPGPEHVPEHLGASVWGAMASSKIKAERTGAAATDTDLKSGGTANVSAFGHYGYYWGQLDVLRLEQKTEGPFVLAGAGFGTGSTVGAAAVVVRAAREMCRFDMPWHAHYHLDFGFRYTIAAFSAGNGVDRRTRNEGFLSPEITLVGTKVLDEQHAIHTRTSLASNGATTGRETALDWAIYYNTRILETPDSRHDVAFGVRGLHQKLGFTDKGTGQETTFTNDYLGPELSYTYRW